jgi:hypothetical protein
MKLKNILVIILLTFIFCASGEAFAMTAAEKQALIAQIQDQIAQLTAQLNQMLAEQQNSTTWCHTFNSDLGYAQSGTSEMAQLHVALTNEGISYAPDDINTYSTGTANAVIRFQAKHNILPQSGYTGFLTRAKLNQLYGCDQAQTQTPETIQTPQTQTPETIQTPQTQTPQTQTPETIQTPQTPVCTSSNWSSVLSPTTCPSSGQQTKYWTKVGTCTGGVTYSSSETVSCNYQADTSGRSIKLIYPNGGELLEAGKTYEIKWQSNLVGKTDIALIKGEDTAISIASNVSGYLGKYSFTPTATDSNNYKIFIYATDFPSVQDKSDGYFGITGAGQPNCIKEKDYFKRDVLSYKGLDGVTRQLADTCSRSGQLIEYFCNGILYQEEYYTCPNGCSDGACNKPSPIANLNIIFPAGNETFVPGETVRIRWDAAGFSGNAGIQLSYVSLVGSTNSQVTSTPIWLTKTPVLASQGYFDWQIKAEELPHLSYRAVDFKVSLVTYNGTQAPENFVGRKDSKSFFISLLNSPSLTVTSPKSSDVFTYGRILFDVDPANPLVIGVSYSKNYTSNVRILSGSWAYLKDKNNKIVFSQPLSDLEVANGKFEMRPVTSYDPRVLLELPDDLYTIEVCEKGLNPALSNNSVCGTSAPFNIKPKPVTETGSCAPSYTPYWKCTEWSKCSGINGEQQRTCTDGNYCGITSSKPHENQACVASCTPNWKCGEWSLCDQKTKTQKRVCTDSNGCGVAGWGFSPLKEQSCGGVDPYCTPNWTCSAWRPCTNGIKTRSCSDLKMCNATFGPNTMESCSGL